MNRDDFNYLHSCEPTPSQRDIDIEKRLIEYYEAAAIADSNIEVSKLWFEFVRWCKDCGYSSHEINKAKDRVLK